MPDLDGVARHLRFRLDRHERNGVAVAKWLAQQQRVAQVLYPALDCSLDGALWKRDFAWASSLISSPAMSARVVQLR